MRVALSFTILLALAIGAPAQNITREGPLEKRVLFAGEDTEGWGTPEVTLASAPKRGKEGRAALHLHIAVDYHGGEEKYPIGWPRLQRSLKEEWRSDWSAFDKLRLSIFTETSRAKLPHRPLLLILYTPDKPRNYTQVLTEIKKGAWAEIEIPLARVPRYEKVTYLQLVINDSDYQHGDTVDFYIDEIALLRYAEPTIAELAVRPALAFADAAAPEVNFRALGIPPGKTLPASISLLRNDQELFAQKTTVGRGPHALALELRKRPLPEGDYRVRVRLGDGAAAEAPLRLVQSPWPKAKNAPAAK